LNFSPIQIFSEGLKTNPQKDVELLWNQSFFLLQEAFFTILPREQAHLTY